VSAWGEMPRPDPEPAVGPLAVTVYPSGDVFAERLPAEPAAMAAFIHQIIGGHFEGIGVGDWVAYLDSDGRRDLAPNVRATEIAADLGWFALTPFNYLLGAVVFLGRDGVTEVDVPARVAEIAERAAGAWVTVEIAHEAPLWVRTASPAIGS
jgi:hypothetical protein